MYTLQRQVTSDWVSILRSLKGIQFQSHWGLLSENQVSLGRLKLDMWKYRQPKASVAFENLRWREFLKHVKMTFHCQQIETCSLTFLWRILTEPKENWNNQNFTITERAKFKRQKTEGQEPKFRKIQSIHCHLKCMRRRTRYHCRLNK